ncbi:hypothetical protein [Roseovarius sp. Pro17]|uniref:hypothetical protein n=1 Tax=Roseovarius sp. Pro17 TaxID=3108175 RepID=UPI002D775CA8|nr:hypothetical protein [Roseovarius sp. Pro17]
MNPENTSIGDYLKFFGDGPGGRMLRWQFATGHEDRLEILEEALTECYSRLVDGRKIDVKLDENQLSKQVAQMLSFGGIAARNEQDVNGHCDIVVEGNHGFMWLGEAKVHKSYGWLQDGFGQLSTRYGTAMLGRDHGELIIYYRGGNAIDVLEEWKKRLLGTDPKITLVEDIEKPQLFFRTSHTCQNSGCGFHVRHTIIPLYHQPEK